MLDLDLVKTGLQEL